MVKTHTPRPVFFGEEWHLQRGFRHLETAKVCFFQNALFLSFHEVTKKKSCVFSLVCLKQLTQVQLDK